uniref:Btz domain-containing protein n=1 Tax=Tetraselmis sp. GSL018 TaxID=582737 RepID=A0A061R5C9_9CHLO|mmetsp:Transcript_3927/g.9386  ORF Transcript_3927/g.9386 Transcript_3927/m.9386 type:complete len:701 (-) Transcript_3927:473-2575(-)
MSAHCEEASEDNEGELQGNVAPPVTSHVEKNSGLDEDSANCSEKLTEDANIESKNLDVASKTADVKTGSDQQSDAPVPDSAEVQPSSDGPGPGASSEPTVGSEPEALKTPEETREHPAEVKLGFPNSSELASEEDPTADKDEEALQGGQSKIPKARRVEMDRDAQIITEEIDSEGKQEPGSSLAAESTGFRQSGTSLSEPAEVEQHFDRLELNTGSELAGEIEQSNSEALEKGSSDPEEEHCTNEGSTGSEKLESGSVEQLSEYLSGGEEEESEHSEEDDVDYSDPEESSGVSSDSAGEEDEGQEGEGEGEEPAPAVRKKPEPFDVPRSGAFFMHDDRLGGESDSRQRRAPSRGKKLWDDDDGGKWTHDKFETLALPPDEDEDDDHQRHFGSRRGRGRGRGRGPGGRRGRGAARGSDAFGGGQAPASAARERGSGARPQRGSSREAPPRGRGARWGGQEPPGRGRGRRADFPAPPADHSEDPPPGFEAPARGGRGRRGRGPEHRRGRGGGTEAGDGDALAPTPASTLNASAAHYEPSAPGGSQGSASKSLQPGSEGFPPPFVPATYSQAPSQQPRYEVSDQTAAAAAASAYYQGAALSMPQVMYPSAAQLQATFDPSAIPYMAMGLAVDPVSGAAYLTHYQPGQAQPLAAPPSAPPPPPASEPPAPAEAPGPSAGGAQEGRAGRGPKPTSRRYSAMTGNL